MTYNMKVMLDEACAHNIDSESVFNSTTQIIELASEKSGKWRSAILFH